MIYNFLILLIVVSASKAFRIPKIQVVNGVDAFPGEFPFIVSLRVFNDHYCAGTILDDLHILTAAHCVYNTKPLLYDVQYGTNVISADDVNSIKVESLKWHQNFTPSKGNPNDIAVLKLVSPIPTSDMASPITLPDYNTDTPENEEAVLVGWGATNSSGVLSTHLQKVVIEVFTDDDCEQAHKATGPTNRQYHICAGLPEGGKGQCTGDSGGPLVVNNTQMGVVSWSVKPCASQGFPGVFTKVSSYIDWIKETIQELSD